MNIDKIVIRKALHKNYLSFTYVFNISFITWKILLNMIN